MLLFESSLPSAFRNVLSYSVIWAYSVSDFEKCTTLFRYFSLLCYLEFQSIGEDHNDSHDYLIYCWWLGEDTACVAEPVTRVV